MGDTPSNLDPRRPNASLQMVFIKALTCLKHGYSGTNHTFFVAKEFVNSLQSTPIVAENTPQSMA